LTANSPNINAYYPGDWVRPRANHGDWIALVDLMEIYTGHREFTKQGSFQPFDEPSNITLEVEEANKSESLLPKEPWNTTLAHPLWVWTDNNQYKMLYHAHSSNSVCYSISDDGYHWNSQTIGEVEFNGSKNNNIIPNAPHGPAFFEDPTAAPEERFKSISNYGGGFFDGNTGKPLGANSGQLWTAQEYDGNNYDGPPVILGGKGTGWTSPDTINWKRLPEPVIDQPIDGGITAGYDPDTETYFMYCRLHGLTSPELPGIGSSGPEKGLVRRAIGLTRTKDFSHWPHPKLVLHPDAHDDFDISFYGSSYFRYPGRSDLHCLLVQVYHQINDHVDTQIAFSRDGISWERPERRAIIPVGATGDGDEGTAYAWSSGLVTLPDGYWGYLYGGGSWLHNIEPDKGIDSSKIRWARWLPHRLCGINADTAGHFTINTIQRTSNHLKLNYRCKPGGWITVELLRRVPSGAHAEVAPLEGFTFAESDRMTGDSLDKIVTWDGNSDISGIGDTVAIRIKMFGAKLFAYTV